MAAMEQVRFGGECGDESLALVGDAGSAFGGRYVGVLYGCGLAGDEGVLPIINGVSVSIRRGADTSLGPRAG